MKEYQTGWQKAEPVERFYIKYYQEKNLTTHEAIIPNHRDKEVKSAASTVFVTN